MVTFVHLFCFTCLAKLFALTGRLRFTQLCRKKIAEGDTIQKGGSIFHSTDSHVQVRPAHEEIWRRFSSVVTL